MIRTVGSPMDEYSSRLMPVGAVDKVSCSEKIVEFSPDIEAITGDHYSRVLPEIGFVLEMVAGRSDTTLTIVYTTL